MFGLESMLKDDWSGYYSQGYMYFDNCSSLFLPKVGSSRSRQLVLNTDTFLNVCI